MIWRLIGLVQRFFARPEPEPELQRAPLFPNVVRCELCRTLVLLDLANNGFDGAELQRKFDSHVCP